MPNQSEEMCGSAYAAISKAHDSIVINTLSWSFIINRFIFQKSNVTIASLNMTTAVKFNRNDTEHDSLYV